LLTQNIFPPLGLIPVLLAPAVAGIITLCIAVVSFIAGLFGIKLKTRGAKKIREFILHPKLLFGISIVSTIATLYFFLRS